MSQASSSAFAKDPESTARTETMRSQFRALIGFHVAVRLLAINRLVADRFPRWSNKLTESGTPNTEISGGLRLDHRRLGLVGR